MLNCQRTSTFTRSALITGVLVLGACTPVGLVVGAGAGVGVSAAQERGIEGRTADLKIEARLFEKFFTTNIDLHGAVGVEVYEGRVMLTGATEKVELADTAVKLAWQVRGVKDVLNEIQIKESGVTDFIRDSWITGQLRSKLTFDKEVLAINYAVETVNGTVYLMGIAQNQAELQRVRAHANNLGYVKDVISHVRVKSPGIQNAGAAPGQNAGAAPGQNAGAAPGQNAGTAPGQNAGTAPGQNTDTPPGS